MVRLPLLLRGLIILVRLAFDLTYMFLIVAANTAFHMLWDGGIN